jgi:hypothetical protein
MMSEQRVRGFVDDDVLRQAGVDAVARGAGEISENQAFDFRVVERVRVRHAVRRDLQLVALETARRPGNPPAQREFETRERLHDERVDVLRVEAHVLQDPGFALRPLGGFLVVDPREVVRAVEHLARAVVVDDLDAITDGAWRELFGRHVDLRHEDVLAVLHAGVLRDHRHFPGWRALFFFPCDRAWFRRHPSACS